MRYTNQQIFLTMPPVHLVFRHHRVTLSVISMIAVVLALGWCVRRERSAAAAQMIEPSRTRTFALTYDVHVSALPSSTARLDVWVPLATTRDGQEVRARR